MTIRNLIKKAQKGNDKAFLKLFQMYELEIYRMAFIYVKNENDALDVVQETAYRSFNRIESLRNPDYFKTWILKIAINCSLDLIKKSSKVVQLNNEMEEVISSDDYDIPLSISLQDLVDGLNEDEKGVVLLRFYHDYTFKEIAETLRIPLGTAKSILYRAIRKLRDELLKGDEMNE
ncbi:sigma-70 family RNA polymerase sigma factor [Ornithinibacillus halophilus]|uniref:RNA polymerase sigma-70 factor, ECF subfamily n=1 Tax=Ornithinibacillus halophilus TaxID=930117 RepID=A0A1M5KIV1_9BACI|nr:sigma-70 family RNA polymerase sigma factor [Ornithinibacillus halophilus]SHG52645.1 RNA polymerase sigma-70 factor, ECF subfamily [Ornithinibacillus halophilus]